MIDSYCRPPYQALLVNPMIRAIHRFSIHPDLITLCALCIGICTAPLMAFSMPKLAVLCLLLSGYLDTLDGSLARAKGLTSEVGTVLDIISDRIVESSIVLGLFLVDPTTRGLHCLLMLGSILLCITSFLVVAVFTSNGSEKGFHYSAGIMERTEAFAFFIAMILAPSAFVPLAITFSALVTLTAVIRIFQFTTR